MNASDTLRRGLVAVTLIPFFIQASSTGSGVLHLDGLLVLRGEHDGTARLVLVPLNGPERVVDVSGHFELDLPLGRVYLLSFERPGMVTKQIYFNTTVPEETRNRELDFPFMVTLYPVGKKGDYAYAGPVGVVYYKPDLNDFGFDSDYALKPGTEIAVHIAALKDRKVAPTPAFVRAPRALPEQLIWSEGQTDPTGPANASAPDLKSERLHSRPIRQSRAPEITIADRPDKVRSGTPNAPASMAQTQKGSSIPAVREYVSSTSPTLDRSRRPTTRVDPLEEIPVYPEEELIVERLRVITIVRLTERSGHVREYRRVADRNGGVLYFRDGLNIPASIYHQRSGR